MDLRNEEEASRKYASIAALGRQCQRLGVALIGGNGRTDERLPALAALPALRHLAFDCCTGVHGLGLECLTRLTSLKVTVGGAAVATSGELVRRVAALPRLQQLDIAHQWVNDGVLCGLTALSGLTSLTVRCSHVTNAALQHITRLAALQELYLSFIGLDALADHQLLGISAREPLDLTALRGLTVLRCLGLRGATLLPPAASGSLPLPALRSLVVERTAVRVAAGTAQGDATSGVGAAERSSCTACLSLFPNLKELSLGWSAACCHGFATLRAPQLSSVTKLTLCGSPQASGFPEAAAIVAQRLAALPRLEVLAFHRLTGLRDDAVLALLSMLPSLSVLVVSRCPGVTAAVKRRCVTHAAICFAEIESPWQQSVVDQAAALAAAAAETGDVAAMPRARVR